MSLSNDDLYQKHNQLIKLKKDAYDKLYNRCKNSIKLTSKTGQLYCFFEIPVVVFGIGYRITNIRGCADYIISKITSENSNIKCTFEEPNIIFFDWRIELKGK
jgi:hypothetical protein